MQNRLQVNSALERLGTETAFEVLARAEALAAAGKDVINLGIGQPDFKTPPHVVEAAMKALQDGAHGYTPAAGIPALRQAVSEDLLKRHNSNVDPSQILITPGAKPIMYFAITIMGEPGAEIMYPNPGFPIYESMIEYTGAKAVPIELKEDAGFAFDADTVLAQVNENTRLIIINSPANPTGGVVPKATLDRLVEGLEKFPNLVILSDEIYSQMLYDGETHVSLLNYESIRDRLIVIDGWSKTYAMTGWRLGYCGASKEIIVPVAPDTFDVNVSSADIVPDTVLRTAYLGNAKVGADVKSIPCSIICNEVALPISAPKGITVAPDTFKTEKEDSLTILPPSSNSTLLKSATSEDVVDSNPINLVPSIVAVGRDV